MDLDYVGGLGRWPVAGLQNPVLQSAGKGHYTRLGLGWRPGRLGLRGGFLASAGLACGCRAWTWCWITAKGGGEAGPGCTSALSRDSVVDSPEQRFEIEIHPFRLEKLGGRYSIQSRSCRQSRGYWRPVGGTPGPFWVKLRRGKQAPQRRTSNRLLASFFLSDKTWMDP